MEPLVSVIKNLLLTWYQISINNPEYLAAVVFLTSIILGTIMAASHRGKVATLKSNFDAERLAFEQDRAKTSHYLDHVEQQLQHTKEELQQAHEQLQSKDQHIEQLSNDYQAAQVVAVRVVNLELQTDQRNKDIAQLVQTLEAGLGIEQSTTATAELDSTALWQRHEGTVKQIIDRLQTTQTLATELQHNQQTLTDQLSTKQAIIQELHETLELQNTRMTQLETDLETQKQLTEQEIQKTVAAIESSEKAKLEVAGVAAIATTKTLSPEPLLEASEIETEQPASVVDSLPQNLADSVAEKVSEVIDVTEIISQQPSVTAIIESVPEVQVVVIPEQSESAQPTIVVSDIMNAEPITVADESAEIVHKQPLYEETSWLKPFKKKTPDLSDKAKSDSVAESLADAVPVVDTAKAAVVHQQALQEKTPWFKPFKKKTKDTAEKDKLSSNEPVLAKATPTIETVSTVTNAQLITESPAPAADEPVIDKLVETESKQPLYEDPSWFKLFKKKTKETKSNDAAVSDEPASTKIAAPVEIASKQVNVETTADSIIEPASEAVATVESVVTEVVQPTKKTLSPKKKSWLNSFVEKFNQMSDHDTYR
jgi:hypothetical protein